MMLAVVGDTVHETAEGKRNKSKAPDDAAAVGGAGFGTRRGER